MLGYTPSSWEAHRAGSSPNVALSIYDQPSTNSLDSENERHIQNLIEELRGHMNILIIAHRLPTVREADVIYVLEQGTVIESGGWNTLRERRWFSALCRAQGIRS